MSANAVKKNNKADGRPPTVESGPERHLHGKAERSPDVEINSPSRRAGVRAAGGWPAKQKTAPRQSDRHLNRAHDTTTVHRAKNHHGAGRIDEGRGYDEDHN